jgi:hypothetical protein
MATGKKKMQSELSKTDVKIVVIVLILLVSIAIGFVEFFYLYRPNDEKLVQAQETLAGLQVKLQEAKRVPTQIEHYKQQIDILEGKTTEEGGEDNVELRQEIDLPTILGIVETSASNAKMELKAISMDGNAAYIKGGVIIQSPDAENGDTPEINASAFYRLGISMEVTSVTYEGLTMFLENVEDAGYYLTTSSASLEVGEDGETYSGTIDFYIYSFVSSSK